MYFLPDQDMQQEQGRWRGRRWRRDGLFGGVGVEIVPLLQDEVRLNPVVPQFLEASACLAPAPCCPSVDFLDSLMPPYLPVYWGPEDWPGGVCRGKGAMGGERGGETLYCTSWGKEIPQARWMHSWGLH